MEKAKVVTVGFLKAEAEFNAYFAPFVSKKVDEQLILGKLTEKESSVKFFFDLEGSDLDKDMYAFTSQMWEETWWNGSEMHYGHTVVLTSEFMADPLSFIEAANAKIIKEHQAKMELRAEQNKAKVERLKAELAEAERVVGVDEKRAGRVN